MTIVGVSLGHREVSEADHWILSLDPAPVMACTHLARVPFPHVAISLTGAGAPGSASGLASASPNGLATALPSSLAAASPTSPAAASPTSPAAASPTSPAAASPTSPAAASPTSPAIASATSPAIAVVSAPELQGAADMAADGGSGRAVIFPGVADLVGVLTVAEVLALSAIERVEVLGGEIPDLSTPLDTGGFVRPQWRDGELVLTVVPAVGGRLVPFETRSPTPCCGSH